MATIVKHALCTDAYWVANQAGMEALYGVGGYYTTITAWTVAVGRDLTSATGVNEVARLEIYGHGWTEANPLSETNIEIGNRFTTDSVCRVELIVVSGRHDWRPDTGFVYTIAAGNYGFIARNDYVLFQGFDFTKGLNTSAFVYQPNNCVFIDCLIHDSLGPVNCGAATYTNCIVWDNQQTANASGCITDGGILSNTVIINRTGFGGFDGDILTRASTCTNVIGYREQAEISNNAYYACTGDYNAINQVGEFIPGSNSVDTFTTDQFMDFDNHDYRLKPSSDLVYLGENGTFMGAAIGPDADLNEYALRAKKTLPNTLPIEANALVDLPIVLKTVDFPDEFLNAGPGSLREGAPDLRITSDVAGLNRLPVDVVKVNVGGSPYAEVHTKVPKAYAGVPIYLWSGHATAEMPSVGYAYGRNAVWEGFGGVWAKGTLVDRTGNGNDLVVFGTTAPVLNSSGMTVTDVSQYLQAPATASLTALATYELTSEVQFPAGGGNCTYEGLNGEFGSGYNKVVIDYVGSEYPSAPSSIARVRYGTAANNKGVQATGFVTDDALRLVYSYDGANIRNILHETVSNYVETGALWSNTEMGIRIGASVGLYGETRVTAVIHSDQWHFTTRQNKASAAQWGVTSAPEPVLIMSNLPKSMHPDSMYPGVKPVGEVEIDWSNPLTEGLSGVFIFDGLRSVKNLVTGSLGTYVGSPNANLSHYDTAYGLDIGREYVSGGASHDYFLGPNDDYYLGSLGQSIAAGMTRLDAGGTRSFQAITLGTRDGHGYTAGAFKLYASDAGEGQRFGATLPAEDSVHRNYCLTRVSGTATATGAIDGVSVNPTITDSTLTTGAASHPLGGNILPGSVGAGGAAYSHFYLWNRSLGGDEERGITADPYQILKPVQQIPTYYPTATGMPVQGGITASMTSNITSEADLVTGGFIITQTITGGVFVTGVDFDNARQSFINGIVSNRTAVQEPDGWETWKSTIPVTAVVRTSDTVVTLTLPAFAP